MSVTLMGRTQTQEVDLGIVGSGTPNGSGGGFLGNLKTVELPETETERVFRVIYRDEGKSDSDKIEGHECDHVYVDRGSDCRGG